MTEIPAPGAYWREREVNGPMDTIRAKASEQFDNSASRSFNVHEAKRQFGGVIHPDFYPLMNESPRGKPKTETLYHQGQKYTVSVSSIEFAAMASLLRPFMGKVRSVVEIGGGYGGLARACLLAFPELERWTIIDLPQVAKVSRWYLTGEAKVQVLDVGDYELAEPADLVIQTRGFMEMSAEEVEWYFSMIQGGRLLNLDGLFWTVNRRKKITLFRDWPWDEKWKVLAHGRWPEPGMVECLLRRGGEGFSAAMVCDR